jgi:hypothetical protein
VLPATYITPDAKCGARLAAGRIFLQVYLSALYCQRRSHYALERTATSYTKAILIIEYIWRARRCAAVPGGGFTSRIDVCGTAIWPLNLSARGQFAEKPRADNNCDPRQRAASAAADVE